MTASTTNQTPYGPSPGYMTLSAQQKYIHREIQAGTMPKDSFRVPQIVSLHSERKDDILYFWQIYSVLGSAAPILRIITRFYEWVADDPVLRDWFAHRPVAHHVRAQAALWMDCFGAGSHYHGAETRLAIHHEAFRGILTTRGAVQWATLMTRALDAEDAALAQCDPRIRPAINSFLECFMSQYGAKYKFATSRSTTSNFGALPPALSLRGKSADELEQLPLGRLKLGLAAEHVDPSGCLEKQDLVKAALALNSS